MKTAIFEIFRAGKHTSANGGVMNWNQPILEQIVKNYDKQIFVADLVIGHPSEGAESYGEVNKLFLQRGSLFAECRVTPELEQLILAGRYKKISASFYLPASTKSPIPNNYYLRHVGFLGATPPAIKGLSPADNAIKMAMFSEQINVNRSDIVFFNEGNYFLPENRQELHQKALQMQRLMGISYTQAIDEILY